MKKGHPAWHNESGIPRNHVSPTPEYRAWSSMRRRCKSKSSQYAPYYRDLGITVCTRWDNYENFLADVGRRPSPNHSLDRYPNQIGNYEPDNVRWATHSEQMSNRRPYKTAVLRNFSDTEIQEEINKRTMEYGTEPAC